MQLHSYPKVWNLGHPAIADLFDGPVTVSEKVDGSQFCFGVVRRPMDGEDSLELCFRSKGAEIFETTTDKNFKPAVETAARLFAAGRLTEGWTYRAEAVARPKHNTAAYERAPAGGMILFDVDTGAQERRIQAPAELAAVADGLHLECVPCFFHGVVADIDSLRALLDSPSILGGRSVEGIVIKNYNRWGDDGKMLMGKLVRDDFKEAHRKEWGDRNPNKAELIDSLIGEYRTNRRWEKAVERLRDAGKLEGSPRDIGLLIREVPEDIKTECEAEIRDALFRHFWPQISRGVTHGLPQWYKVRLMDDQPFGTDA
jgi:hypothetical protein